jgi:hypothetical protein
MIFEKQRWEVWNMTQHPYKHSLAEFSFSNPALPGVTNVESAINWLVAVLYPNAKANVATVAALPPGGNTLNDYRVVLDDGDGNPAGYRWEQREGEAVPSWHKVFDFDWSTDAILAALMDVTQDVYVYQKGKTDLDDTGTPIVGVFSGQRIWGGNLAGQNLTLDANSADNTGYVQVNNNFRPVLDNTFDLATALERFADGYFAGTVSIGTLALSSGSISDTSGSISFADENLSTTGNITGAVITGSSLVADDTVDTITIVPGLITDTTGTISFGSANLVTTGVAQSDTYTVTDGVDALVLEPNNLGTSYITSSLGTINFDDENLITTGTLTVGAITTDSLTVDDIFVDGNSISILTLNTNLNLAANGTGVIALGSDLNGGANDFTNFANGTITTQLTAGNVVLSTGIDTIAGDLTLDSFTGDILLNGAAGSLSSNIDNTYDLGTLLKRFADLFLAGDISDGVNNIAIGTLLAFRSGIWRDLAQTVPAQAGDTLFWDSVNGVWLADHPDTEITHNQITGLTIGDAGHTQFVMLSGRAGGQIVQGGTAASEDLILESTSHATKGYVFTRDVFAPETSASYAAGWSGTDLGDATHYFRDIYSRGEFRGLRLENFTTGTLPAASVQNIGRAVWTTDEDRVYIDTGTSYKPMTIGKYEADTVWDGVITLLNVNVSAEIIDARDALWQLKDNANNFEVMGVTILATSATNVRITSNIPLPAGSYRLVGVE